MKKIMLITMTLLFIFVSVPCFASDVWQKQYVSTLTDGQIKMGNITQDQDMVDVEDGILQKAIIKATKDEAPECEMLKIAVDLKYTPYLIIKNIYSFSDYVGLNTLCECSIAQNINKSIITQAAKDAESKSGENVFSLDEIARVECLRDVGLGFSEAPDATNELSPISAPSLTVASSTLPAASPSTP